MSGAKNLQDAGASNAQSYTVYQQSKHLRLLAVPRFNCTCNTVKQVQPLAVRRISALSRSLKLQESSMFNVCTSDLDLEKALSTLGVQLNWRQRKSTTDAGGSKDEKSGPKKLA